MSNLESLLVLSVIGPASAIAAVQDQDPRALRPAAALSSHEFSGIASALELSDGRVLIADRREARLVVLDLTKGTLTPLGRRGQGPKEYLNVYPAFPLGGDSAFMGDFGSRRWHIVNPVAGTIQQISARSPTLDPTGGLVLGADLSGNVLSQLPQEFQGGPGKRDSDSVLLGKVSLVTGGVDTVGKVLRRPATTTTDGEANGRPQRIQISFRILDPGEDAILSPDGWVAVSRLHPYRVDWRRPDGTWIRGAPLPFRHTPVDRREKEAYRKRLQGGGAVRLPSDDLAWAETIPPFENGALLVSPDGDLIIKRTPTASQPETAYDVVNRAGGLVMRIRLPPNERIVGVGARDVYVAVTDEVGLEQLRRHPWF